MTQFNLCVQANELVRVKETKKSDEKRREVIINLSPVSLLFLLKNKIKIENKYLTMKKSLILDE